MASSIRIDERLVRDGLAQSRSLAQRFLMAGSVRVDGQLIDKSSYKVRDEQKVELIASAPFVSRGGEKLANALVSHAGTIQDNKFNIIGAQAIDIGASTGGFTDCLLQNGAAHVIAIDVGYGQLHASLRDHHNVTNLERTNARYLSKDDLEYAPNLLVCDASFISLKTLLPAVVGLMNPEGWWGMLLIKPQFEAGRERMNKYGRKGVLTDTKMREQVLHETIENLQDIGIHSLAVKQAHPPGPKGNIEFAALVQAASS